MLREEKRLCLDVLRTLPLSEVEFLEDELVNVEGRRRVIHSIRNVHVSFSIILKRKHCFASPLNGLLFCCECD